MQNTSEHDHDEESHHILGAQISAIVLSLVLGLMAMTFNGLLLFTLYKDPLRYFQMRASIVFIQGLAISDFLAGIFIQPIYVISVLFEVTKGKVDILNTISFIGSHVGSKVSILTLVVLATDRLLAIAFPWKYNTFVTRQRAIVTNLLIWLAVAVFEASHSIPSAEKALHTVDVHLQTTVPMFGLLVIFIATYLSFRKHSRAKVFAEGCRNRSNRIQARNLQFEKKIMVTISLVLLVVLISLLPYLIVQQVGNDCHHHHPDEHDDDDDDDECEQSQTAKVVHVLSVSLLCVSCAMNPVLYGWRVPHFRQSLKMVVKSVLRRHNVEVFTRDLSAPSMLQLTEGNSQNETCSALSIEPYRS